MLRLPGLREVPKTVAYVATSQGVSALGSALTSFGLDVWIFQQTGSYSVFALLAVVASVPALAFSPVAGVMADRLPRRMTLIACDLVSLAAVAICLIAFVVQVLNVQIIAFSIVMLSLAGTLRWPAMSATVTLLTPKAALANVNGLREGIFGVVVISGPLLGAFLIEAIGLPWMILLDAMTYIASLMVLVRLVIADAPMRPGQHRTHSERWKFSTFCHECLFGFRWIIGHPRLLRLLLFFALINLAGSVFVVVDAPYLLSFNSPQFLGTGLAVYGAGVVIGGAVYTLTGGSRKKELGVLWGGVLSGFCMIMCGLCRSPILVYTALLGCGFAIPIMNASSGTIWQSQVPIEVQGRVFSVRKMIAWALNPLAILFSIPLAHHISGLLTLGGPYVKVFAAKHWGTGQSASLGLMMAALGLFEVVTAFFFIGRHLLEVDPPPTAAVEALHTTRFGE